MSLDATRWAWQQALNARSKLLLLAFSDRAAEDDTCWPSWARLATDTGLNRKTINSCLARLAEAGLIRDTGRRVGKTKKVVVWELVGVSHRREEKENSPKNGTVPFFPRNSPENGATKQSQKWDPEPTNQKSIKEPTTTGGGNSDYAGDLAKAQAQQAIEKIAGEVRHWREGQAMPKLPESTWSTAPAILSSSPAEKIEPITREWGAALRRGGARELEYPLAYLRELVKRAQNGTFESRPSAAKPATPLPPQPAAPKVNYDSYLSGVEMMREAIKPQRPKE